MLQNILKEINASKTAVSISELSSKLGIEENALEGMIMQLVRMGKLKVDDYTDLGRCAVSNCSNHQCFSCGQSSLKIRTFSLRS